ncbi:MAG TPA: hypothetical protein VHX13_02350 [Acidobacteriaceae bacterium]|jgi:hypothetical protein|nr:hypothetical protein [Acidobacteriaceae bacterium]
MRRFLVRLAVVAASIGSLFTVSAWAAVSIAPIPAEVRSDFFTVTINGQTSPVVDAVSSYYLLNFDLDGPATVSIRAADPHFWDRGVEIQPMRYGIRPQRQGAVITFRIPGPVKLSIARPGDHFADATMLFLLGSPPDRSGITAATPNVRYYGPGVHREEIEAHSGERIYLAPGAVVFGSLSLWQVHDVRVEGRGLIIYDGPQSPSDDQGWMQKIGWHCIVMSGAENVEIDGITCVVRSRTWQVQMRNSRHIGFYNVNIIGGDPRDANQDGIDWLGGGETTIRNAFIRASDDDFAVQGNWEGYKEEEMRVPGEDVTNIAIEDSVVSTSISNTLRVAWPQKSFRSAHVAMRNLDVLHTGYGACGVPFAFFELWADPGGQGTHSDFRFSDIRLEDYYSLMQVRYPNPGVDGVVFSNVSALDGPPMVPSVLAGEVRGVALDGVRIDGKLAKQDADVPVEVRGGAAEPGYGTDLTDTSFSIGGGLIRPGGPVTFRVVAPAPGWQYHWLFGDGTTGEGAVVRHAFPDAEGTLLDGSGRFRVLLHATRAPDDEVWAARSLVVTREAIPALTLAMATRPGLTVVEHADGSTDEDGWLRIPADGGMTLTLLTSRRATLTFEDLPPAPSPELRMQVCGSPGDAVQPITVSAGLRAGLHRIRIHFDAGIENEPQRADGAPVLLWQSATQLPERVPAAAFVHQAW